MIRLQGKHLKVLDDFISVFPLPAWTDFRLSPEYEALINMVSSIHAKYLKEEDSHNFIQEEIIDFVLDHELPALRMETLSEERVKQLRKDLRKRIKSGVESLPREYSIRIQIPNFADWGRFEIQISDRVWLVCDDFTFKDASEYTLQAGLLSSFVFPEPKFDTYLLIKATGYGTPLLRSPVTSEAISIAKCCAFLFTAFGLVKNNYDKSAKANIETAKPSSNSPFYLSDSVARCFGLKAIEDKLFVNDKGGPLLAKGRRASSNEEKIRAFSTAVLPLQSFFDRSAHPDFDSISAAIEWYQDSLISDNQTFSFIAACIGLEALLGTDENMEMMSKRLADRFAALMGRGRADRNKLAQEYAKILDIRGKLVHAKTARLNIKLQESLNKVQSMLFDVIWHELSQMLRTKV